MSARRLPSTRLLLVVLTVCQGLTSAAAAQTTKTAQEIGLQIGPDTTIITTPLRADGFPDYVSYLDQLLSRGVSAEENFWAAAWPVIGSRKNLGERGAFIENRLRITIPEQRVLRTIGQVNESSGDDYERMSDVLKKATSSPWKRAEIPEAARWLDANRECLLQLERAVSLPKAYSPVLSDSQPPLIGTLVTSVIDVRELGRLLMARAMLRLGEGEDEASWKDLSAALRLARHMQASWTLIDSLIAAAIRSEAVDGLEVWLSRTKLDAQQLTARWKEIEPLLQPRPLTAVLETERLLLPDTILAIASGACPQEDLLEASSFSFESNWDQTWTDRLADRIRHSATKWAGRYVLAATDVNLTLRTANLVYGEMIQAVGEKTHSARVTNLKTLADHYRDDAALAENRGELLAELLLGAPDESASLTGRVLAAQVLPMIESCESSWTAAESKMTVLRALFRLRAKFDDSKEPPSSLDAVFDDPAENIDPFTGEPLRMWSDERGIVIYSVGPNGRDDQGRRSAEPDQADDEAGVLAIPEAGERKR